MGLKNRRWTVIFCWVTQEISPCLEVGWLQDGLVLGRWNGLSSLRYSQHCLHVCVWECNLEKQDPEHLGLFAIRWGAELAVQIVLQWAFGKALGVFRAFLQSSCRATFLCLPISKNYLHATVMELRYLKLFLKPWITSFWEHADLQLWLLEGALCASPSVCSRQPQQLWGPSAHPSFQQSWGLPWGTLQRQSSSPSGQEPGKESFGYQLTLRQSSLQWLLPLPVWVCLGRERSSWMASVAGWSRMETCP